MDEDKITAIGKALRSDGHRVKALGIIAKVDRLSDSLVTSWIDDIVYALNDEDVEYNKYQILEQLRRMADAYPRESVDAESNDLRGG